MVVAVLFALAFYMKQPFVFFYNATNIPNPLLLEYWILKDPTKLDCLINTNLFLYCLQRPNLFFRMTQLRSWSRLRSTHSSFSWPSSSTWERDKFQNDREQRKAKYNFYFYSLIEGLILSITYKLTLIWWCNIILLF
jgi:hypothetical protein